MEHIFHTLREANKARDFEWTKGESIQDYTWRATELAGEVGEVCELLLRPAIDLAHLTEELADGVICIDLAGYTLGLTSIPIQARGSIDWGGVRTKAAHLATDTLLLCNSLKKLERERRGWVGSRADPNDVLRRLTNIMAMLGCVASYLHIDLTAATEEKFNATSVKNGLATRLYLRGSTEPWQNG